MGENRKWYGLLNKISKAEIIYTRQGSGVQTLNTVKCINPVLTCQNIRSLFARRKDEKPSIKMNFDVCFYNMM